MTVLVGNAKHIPYRGEKKNGVKVSQGKLLVGGKSLKISRLSLTKFGLR